MAGATKQGTTCPSYTHTLTDRTAFFLGWRVKDSSWTEEPAIDPPIEGWLAQTSEPQLPLIYSPMLQNKTKIMNFFHILLLPRYFRDRRRMDDDNFGYSQYNIPTYTPGVPCSSLLQPSECLHTETWRCHLEPKTILQSDALEEALLVPQRTFKKLFFKAPFLVPQKIFPIRVL